MRKLSQKTRILSVVVISVLVHGAFAAALLAKQKPAKLIRSESVFEIVTIAEKQLKTLQPSEEPELESEPELELELESEPEPESELELEPEVEKLKAKLKTKPKLKKRKKTKRLANRPTATNAYVKASYKASKLNNRKPRYPLKARRRGAEGVVFIMVRVDMSGKASNIRVIKSSGNRLLDGEARRTVSSWRFIPAISGGRKVSSSVKVPIRFKLR